MFPFVISMNFHQVTLGIFMKLPELFYEFLMKIHKVVKSFHEVRQEFRTRFGLQPFAGNYSHDRRFAGSQWLCKCREEREEEAHLLSGQCKVYGDLTLQYDDLTNDDNLVSFFNDVLARREELDKV